MRKLLCSLAAVLIGALAGTPASASAPGPDVPVDGGVVHGTLSDGVRIFTGVPYADLPARWQAPQPVKPWKGVRGPSRCGAGCLDVDAPDGLKRPVLVLLHDDRLSSRMAARGLLVVTVHYRTGVDAGFGLPGLAGSGTYGMQDQQAALRWVRKYAEIFGGDPRNVTVVGGSDVCAQLTSPSARGLFDKAIMESSSCLTYWPAGLLNDHPDAGSPFVDRDHVARLGIAAARKIGCSHDVLNCVRKKDGLSGFDFWAYGSPLLPAQPAAALSTGHYWPVPVLASVRPNYDGDVDTAGLKKAFGNDAAKVEAHYPPESRGDVANDSVWACPMLETARVMAAKKPVYVYESEDRPLSAWSRFAATGTTGWDAFPHVRGVTDHQCAFWSTITVG